MSTEEQPVPSTPAPAEPAALVSVPDLALTLPPPPGEGDFGPLTHVVEVQSYVDNRNIMIQHRRTVFGVAPRAFTPWLAFTMIQLVKPNGKPFPQRVEAGFDAADVAEAFSKAGPALAESANRVVSEMEKMAISEAIRAGARLDMGGMLKRVPGRTGG